MNTEISVYESADFGSIRMFEGDGEIYAVASDFAKALEYASAKDMIRSLESDEFSRHTVPTKKGPREAYVINEAGIYHAMLMRKAACIKDSDARARVESIQHWVTHEVLPSIRRHGAYVNPAGAESDEELVARALDAAHAIIARRERRIAALESENERMRPMAEVGEAVTGSDDSIPVADLARILHQAGVDVGQNRLFAQLREDGYLIGSKGAWNRPYQRYLEQGLFEVRESSFRKPDGTRGTSFKTMVTGKGQAYFLRRYAHAERLGVVADG